MSEARKFHLNLIVANQFTTQLTEEIRDAVFGNIGTVISFRVGTNDAEFLAKYFTPAFDSSDLQRVPNHNAIVRMLIGGVPSQPFSMAGLPPLGTENKQLFDALKQLSAAKYGRPRAEIEAEIFERLKANEAPKPGFGAQAANPFGAPAGGALPTAQSPFGNTAAPAAQAAARPASFLDDWLSKRNDQPARPVVAPSPFGAAPAAPLATPVAAAAPPAPANPFNPTLQPKLAPATPNLASAASPSQDSLEPVASLPVIDASPVEPGVIDARPRLSTPQPFGLSDQPNANNTPLEQELPAISHVKTSLQEPPREENPAALHLPILREAEAPPQTTPAPQEETSGTKNLTSNELEEQEISNIAEELKAGLRQSKAAGKDPSHLETGDTIFIDQDGHMVNKESQTPPGAPAEPTEPKA